MKKYALYPGCLITLRFPHFEFSTTKVLEKIGIKIEQLKDVTCCPEQVSMQLLSPQAWYTMAARNICLAEQRGLDILTLCNGCNATLYKVNEDLKYEMKLRERVNDQLKKVGKNFAGKIYVKSILRVLYEEVGLNKIKHGVKKPLSGFKIAVHYGCHIFDEIKDYDDPKNPRSLEDLVSILGADVTCYPSKMLCCAAFARFINEELAFSVVKEKLNDLVSANADCLVVICPYCFFQYDLGQIILNQRFKKNFQIPVLYYPQLLGLAMGFDARDMGLQFHKIKSDKLMDNE